MQKNKIEHFDLSTPLFAVGAGGANEYNGGYNRSSAKVGGQKTRFRSPSNSTAVLNLNCSLVFFFNSFFLYFFEKVPKTGQSCTAFGAKS
jgi:hypothetical protein